MNGSALDDLRHHAAGFLAAHAIGILILPGDGWAMPVRYTSRDLLIGCLLPRWAEIEVRMERASNALLMIPEHGSSAAQSWLTCEGRISVTRESWPGLLPDLSGPIPAAELSSIIELTPARIDIVDERVSWGWRQTLDL